MRRWSLAAKSWQVRVMTGKEKDVRDHMMQLAYLHKIHGEILEVIALTKPTGEV